MITLMAGDERMRMRVVSTAAGLSLAVLLTSCGDEDPDTQGGPAPEDGDATTIETYGFAEAEESDGVSEPADPEQSYVRGLGTRFVVDAVGLVSESVGADGERLVAGDGDRLLVFTYEFEDSQDDDVSPVVTLDADGEQVLAAEDLWPSSETLAVAVPEDVGKVSFAVETGEITQHLEVVNDGELAVQRGDDAMQIWYRDSESDELRADIDTQREVPFRVEPDIDLVDTITAESAFLSATIGEGDDIIYASGPDRALLQVLFDESGSNGWSRPVAPKDVTFTPDGGEPIPARLERENPEDFPFLGGEFYWDVPADVTRGTVTIVFTDGPHEGEFRSDHIDIEPDSVTFDVVFE